MPRDLRISTKTDSYLSSGEIKEYFPRKDKGGRVIYSLSIAAGGKDTEKGVRLELEKILKNIQK